MPIRTVHMGNNCKNNSLYYSETRTLRIKLKPFNAKIKQNFRKNVNYQNLSLINSNSKSKRTNMFSLCYILREPIKLETIIIKIYA